MAITLDSFLEEYPEIQAKISDGFISEELLETYVTRATAKLTTAKWGDCLDEAQGLLVAHWATLKIEATDSDGKGETQITEYEAKDDVRIRYANPSATNSGSNRDTYDRTIYGQQFLELRSQLIMPIGIF